LTQKQPHKEEVKKDVSKFDQETEGTFAYRERARIFDARNCCQSVCLQTGMSGRIEIPSKE